MLIHIPDLYQVLKEQVQVPKVQVQVQVLEVQVQILEVQAQYLSQLQLQSRTSLLNTMFSPSISTLIFEAIILQCNNL